MPCYRRENRAMPLYISILSNFTLSDNGTVMCAKHGNLVDADASSSKTTTRHLESRLEVI